LRCPLTIGTVTVERLTGPQKIDEVLAAAVRVGGRMALWRFGP